MKWNITFTERAKLKMEQLIKQIPITLQEAKDQAKWLSNHKKSSMVSNKKK
jgi:hypothetical protein